SNGNNLIEVKSEKLRPTADPNVFIPSNPWLEEPYPSNIKVYYIEEGEVHEVVVTPNDYEINFGDSPSIVFREGIVPEDGWVEADYTARNDIYFQPHNGSIEIAMENGSSENFNIYFEIDEFVPKF